MKITYKGDYALKAILDLALHYGSMVTIHELADRIDAPIKFLEQVLLDLNRGGFAQSKRGKVGGYQLAKQPSQIKLGEVIRYIDGPIEPIACTEREYTQCRDIYRCIFRSVWQRVGVAISEVVDTLTFADLVKMQKKPKQSLHYEI
ncbi:MAG: Rrf2 family transcriptional regulator [Candidatus Omnitrophica bacterium]|nr:Rrf2 family transcriptional regulator [Candidatus Omnitrophota bacterium]